MLSTHNEGKFVVAERFIKSLKNKIYRYMTSKSKNVYIDKLYDIVNKYNNTYHSTIKNKPVDVKPGIYIESSKESSNYQDPKFKIGHSVRISKYKNIFAMAMFQIGLKKLLWLKKLKTLFHGHMLLVILKSKKLLEHFRKMNCKRQTKNSWELKR